MATDAIQATEAKFRSDPDTARSAPTVTGRLSEGRAELTSGNFTWHADLPPALGGTGSAPSPTQLLLGALAGCAVVFVRDTLAPQLEIPVTGVEATVRCHTDARGLLGLDAAQPDLQNVTLDVRVETPDGEPGVAEIARVWRERCPIFLALQKPTEVSVEFRTA